MDTSIITARFLSRAIPVALLALAAGGCGGGGGATVAGAFGGPSNGIGGSGATSSGTIDGFGSIFVNGVEFETTGASIIVDGQDAREDDLGLGMVVLVRGEINDDGVSGNADLVMYNGEVEGPIGAIQNGQDNDAKLLTILGIDVIVERTGTVFEGVTFDSLSVGDVVEVSGFPEDGNILRATRVEHKSGFVSGETGIEVKGVVSNLTDTQFNLGDYLVDYSAADLSEVAGGALDEGRRVEVHGTVRDLVITATRIEDEDDITRYIDDQDEFSVQGAIAGFVSAAQFEVDGVSVDASGASFTPADLVLADGVLVEAEGTWDGSVLRAQTVEARRGRVEIEAAVQSVDSGAGTVTLGLFSGSVTVQVDARTLLDDDTHQAEPLTLADIGSGDFLEVEALQNAGSLLATRIDRDAPDGDLLQAPVDSFVAGVEITLLGITYSTAGADFEDLDGNALSAEAFFGQLQVGDLVKVKDEEPADGVADEVEFEFAGSPDGGREFHHDDDSEDAASDVPEADDDTGALDDGSDDDGAVVDDGAADDGMVDDGAADDGAVDEGALDDGAIDDGAIDDGTVDDGAVDDGAGDISTPDDGTV